MAPKMQALLICLSLIHLSLKYYENWNINATFHAETVGALKNLV